MALFKAVKKPLLLRKTSQAEPSASLKRPRYAPKTAPCAANCPIGCDIRGMLSTIADAEADCRTIESALELAWRRITAHNPFPSVCARLCLHPCEDNCHRQLKEGTVAVHVVERFVGDYAIECRFGFTRVKELAQAVAVTSAGPAGLAAAYHLARRGYRVTIFENSGEPGGVMRAHVPDEILDAEIQRILDLGVELRCASGMESAGEDYALVVETAHRETGDASAVATAIAAGIAIVGQALSPAGAQAARLAPKKAVAARERIRPEWYKDQPRIDDADALTTDGVVLESRRCFSCGMCMGCGNCWSYCTKGGFERIVSARRYKLNVERCNGCGKCADGCPSGYIDLA